MNSVLREIGKIRTDNICEFDVHNTNRYSVCVKEINGARTAYCFSTPIYTEKTGRIVDMSFRFDGKSIFTRGSNAEVRVTDSICMKNDIGSCEVIPTEKLSRASSKEICYGSSKVRPTTNGILYLTDVQQGKKATSVLLKVSSSDWYVNANDRTVALMVWNYTPFVVISAIGALDANGNIIAPATIEYEKVRDKEYQLSVSTVSDQATQIMFEINLYEEKLFQDTTVESAHPHLNNVYGSVSFLGRTMELGEQWLYTRANLNKLSEFLSVPIKKMRLHLPCLNCSENVVTAYQMQARFCSIGSTWENKIREFVVAKKGIVNNGYLSIDADTIMLDPQTHYIKINEGILLRASTKEKTFTALSTGDSYFAPQILEIQYR